MSAPSCAPTCSILLALAACGTGAEPQLESVPTQHSEETTGDSVLAGAARREKIGNLQGIGHLSRIVFASYPERPHELELSFAFPDRARSQLRPEGARSAQRALSYRFGDRVWSIAPGQKDSEELPAPRASEAVLEFELRRALFLWPQGFEWKTLKGKRLIADITPFGHLEAQVAGDASGQPDRLDAYDGHGQARESFRNVSWVADGSRLRPSTFDVYLRDSPVWAEEVLAVDRTSRYLDAWYLPADQRESTRGQAVRTCYPIQLGSLVLERHALAIDMNLAQAIRKAEGLIATSSFSLSPSPHVELEPGGQPRAIWLVLAESEGLTPPPGWELLQGGPATSRFLPEPKISNADLRELAAAAAESPRALFLRVQAGGEAPRRAELVSLAPLPARNGPAPK